MISERDLEVKMYKTSAQEALIDFKKEAVSSSLAKRVLTSGGKYTPTVDDIASYAYHQPRLVSRAAGLPSPFPSHMSGAERAAKGYSDFGGPELTRGLRDFDEAALDNVLQKILRG
jgi:hypothetical protein